MLVHGGIGDSSNYLNDIWTFDFCIFCFYKYFVDNNKWIEEYTEGNDIYK